MKCAYQKRGGSTNVISDPTVLILSSIKALRKDFIFLGQIINLRKIFQFGSLYGA